VIYPRRSIRGRRWHWRLQAGNGEIIASGEAYVNRADCVHAVELVQQSYAAAVEVRG
jgi:uncharacterized protein YegP (UPF0339 family)